MDDRSKGLLPTSEKHSKLVLNETVENEMETSYLQYSMSVIVARALPDVRDGLKPVHRRILYVMDKNNLGPQSKHSKSAQIVGDVMGKYHPHGDTAIYDAMVRLAQPFNTRYPLVDGQGNFGSMDGDPAAAYRYTEARMTRASAALLDDIDKETVPFRDNFDGSQQEPEVLPAKLPNLLLNGQVGIAVGMATNIPPHNLNELVDATITQIDNPEATLDDLTKHVKGPDFPTGAVVYGIQPRVLGLHDIINEYIKQRQVVVRRRTEFELRKAQEEAHVLEGLKIALDHIDEVISTIRASQTTEEAHANLVKKFKLTDIQARAILAMQLR